MAGHGGRREGAGRKPGAVSQAKRDLAAMAGAHAEAALQALADIAAHGESEAARVSASVAILDRAFGKPRQAVEVAGDGGGPVTTITRRIVDPMTPELREALDTIAARLAREGAGFPTP